MRHFPNVKYHKKTDVATERSHVERGPVENNIEESFLLPQNNEETQEEVPFSCKSSITEP